MSSHADTFHSLHAHGELLILPNAWDAGSARIIEDAGAKAIATTSAGVSWGLGYPDGDVLPVASLARLVADIAKVIRVPLSVDFEGGYTKDPAKIGDHLAPILDAGAVGINIEDGEETPALLVKKIEQARRTADKAGVKLFINARTDVFLAELGEPGRQVEETISRANRYREAGADGIFVPGLASPADLTAIVPEIKIPLNVMAVPDLLSAKELSKLGVRRLSCGGAIAYGVWKLVSQQAKGFLQSGNSNPLYTEIMTYSHLQELFAVRS